MKGLIVTANVAYSPQQTWGSEIAKAQRKSKAKYLYKKLHDTDSIIVVITYLALAEEKRNRQEATAPEETEKVNIVSMGIERLQQIVRPFDYNNMPLDTMGCDVQVHKKKDKRGTWAYHSVCGWYLATSHENYCTHLCHIKTTNRERLTNTAQFRHKSITKPTITPAEKIMAAIADCAKAIK